MEKLINDVDDLIFSNTLQVILDLVDECVMILDKHGNIILYNQACANLDNLKRDDVLGHHLTECYHLNESNSASLQVLRKKIPVLDLYQDYSTVSGNHIISVSSSYPLMHNNEFVGALTVTKNIYRFKKLLHIISDAEGAIKIHSDNNYTFEQIVGKSWALMNCIRIARKAAKTNSPILIYGDTGTGKELIAQGVHSASGLKGPFVSLNCAAIPESLLESILFGTSKGAFTGAMERQGLFEDATNGTLFLDEINSMNSSQQAKLLRVLETSRVRRVGENKEREINVRVISAMNISPLKAVEQKMLREDIFYRLSVVNIRVPSLMERKEDIHLLAKFFINYYNNLFNCKVRDLSPEVLNLFMQYNWPGNIRELRHVIEYAMNMVEDEEIITRDYLSPLFIEQIDQRPAEDEVGLVVSNSSKMKNQTLKSITEGVELEIIKRVLQETNGNVNETASQLGLSRQNLDYKLKKHKLFP